MHSEELEIHPRIIRALKIIMQYVVQHEDKLDIDQQETQDVSNTRARSTVHAQTEAGTINDHTSQTPENHPY